MTGVGIGNFSPFTRHLEASRSKLAIKLYTHLVQYAYKLVRKLVLHFIAKVRNRELTVTLLIPIDFFGLFCWGGVKQCLGSRWTLFLD